MNEITLHQPSNDIEVIQRTAKLLAASGYFETAKDLTIAVAQIGTQIMAGAEMGMGPFTAVQSIHIIKGKPTMSANAMAAAVKAHPKYDYRVRKNEDTCVTIEFFQGGESLGVSTFTANDAKRAGTGNMGKYPRNMLFARAMSNGVRWHCPDVFMGNAVYTADELGEPSHEATDRNPEPEPESEPDDSSIHIEFEMDDVEEIDPEPEPATDPNDAPMTEFQRRTMHSVGSLVYGKGDAWNAKRHELVAAITGNSSSSKDLTSGQAQRLIDGMRNVQRLQEKNIAAPKPEPTADVWA